MDDFTIRVKNIPHHLKYGDNNEILRSYIISHFEGVIKDQLKIRA